MLPSFSTPYPVSYKCLLILPPSSLSGRPFRSNPKTADLPCLLGGTLLCPLKSVETGLPEGLFNSQPYSGSCYLEWLISECGSDHQPRMI